MVAVMRDSVVAKDIRGAEATRWWVYLSKLCVTAALEELKFS